jgi:hypothetical protein
MLSIFSLRTLPTRVKPKFAHDRPSLGVDFQARFSWCRSDGGELDSNKKFAAGVMVLIVKVREILGYVSMISSGSVCRIYRSSFALLRANSYGGLKRTAFWELS